MASNTMPLRNFTTQAGAEPSHDQLDSFGQLVHDINKILGPTNGIDSAGVDVEELKAVMRAYESAPLEWKKYAFADPTRAYTRNLVDRGNGKSNLLILVWTPGQSSPIHDHANAHCVMRILKGRLQETIYSWPCEGDDEVPCGFAPEGPCPSTQHRCNPNDGTVPHALSPRKNSVYGQGEVTYMSDTLGLHRVGNPSMDDFAVSLHLYTPPNAAKHGCHIFNESSGNKTHVQQCHFYSELGVKM